MHHAKANNWWEGRRKKYIFLNATMFSCPSGCLCISKCQLCETLHRSLMDITHAHTFTFSVAQLSLPWWLWNHSGRQPLQNVMSQATWAPTSTARCWNNGGTCSAAPCPWNPLHLFWQFQLMLKWNEMEFSWWNSKPRSICCSICLVSPVPFCPCYNRCSVCEQEESWPTFNWL